ncbi:Short-chain dehydrogenase TIC 32, chloroplastic [Linum grandiflorum]
MWVFGWKGESGFSARSTAEQVTSAIDGTSLTAIVTGASSGIGLETTRVLALRGVHIVMAVRNVDAGYEARRSIMEDIPTAKLDVMKIDLSSLASVRKFAADFVSKGLPLNILINNAGIMACPFSLSQDNVELQFATNHLGHFLLTNLLLETMKKTAHASSREGRIVIVSSLAHVFAYREGIRFDRINDESGYFTMRAYGQSKLANILHAKELARRLQEDGANITVNSLHPGSIVTNLLRHHSLVNGIANMFAKFLLKNVQQGAATSCYLAMHPQVAGVTGKFFMDCNIAEPNSQAEDVKLAKKLWDFSLRLTTYQPN